MIVYVKYDAAFHEEADPSESYDFFDEDNEPVGWIIIDGKGNVSIEETHFPLLPPHEIYENIDFKPLHCAITWFFNQGILLDWSQVPDEHLPEGIKR